MEPTPALMAVAIYAAALTFVFLWLTTHVGLVRGRLKISIGDGGNPLMVRAMRGQANFCENVPITLVLLLLMALIGTPAVVIHLFGATLLVARLLHGWHFAQDDAPGWQRAAGAGLTMLVQLLAGLGLLAHAVI